MTYQVGLTMDYDMFLSTHVYELRKDERYNTRHSILKGLFAWRMLDIPSLVITCVLNKCGTGILTGLAESGTTITTAGIIMTVNLIYQWINYASSSIASMTCLSPYIDMRARLDPLDPHHR